MKKLLLTSICIFTMLFVNAQKKENKPFLNVSASIEYISEPGVFYLKIALTKEEDCNMTIDKIEKKYFSLLKSKGVDVTKFNNNSIESEIQNNQFDEKRRKDIYFLTKNEKEIIELSKIKLCGVTPDNGKIIRKVPKGKEEKIRQEAVDKAKSKAKILAKVLNKKVGKIIDVYDDSFSSYGFNNDGNPLRTYTIRISFELLDK